VLEVLSTDFQSEKKKQKYAIQASTLWISFSRKE
jgi:hypothetical protein